MTKRKQIFTWLKDKQFSICLLQETHSGDGTHDLWAKEWGATSYFSGTKNNGEGVAVLFNPNFSYTVKGYTEIITGRLQAVEVTINDKDLVILNIYGPNTDDVTHFNSLETYLKDNTDKTIIIGGDFNTVLDINIDKKNGRTDTHKLCRTYLNTLTETFNLVDIWRLKHPNLKQYTWHSSTKPPIFSRLDYFLLSDNLINSTASCEHRLSYKSDHNIVELNIDIANFKRGPGYFKLNNSFILDKTYQESIRKNITEITTMIRNANPNTLWELIKGTIRNESIKIWINEEKGKR